jgi:hypothetical protein
MRRILLILAATLAIVLVAAASAAPASALRVGYGQFGGFDRDGYEYSR